MRILILILLGIVLSLPTPPPSAAEVSDGSACRETLEDEGFSEQKVEALCEKIEQHRNTIQTPVSSERQARPPSTKPLRTADLEAMYRNGSWNDVQTRIRLQAHQGTIKTEHRLILGKCIVAEAGEMKSSGNGRWKSKVHEALGIARSVLQTRPSDPDALFIAGRCKILAKRPTSGIKYIRKALKLTSNPKPEYLERIADGILDDPNIGSRGMSEHKAQRKAKRFYTKALQYGPTEFERERILKKMVQLK